MQVMARMCVCVCMCVCSQHAHILCMCKRHEQSLSLLSNALKLRKEALGARHIKIVGNQVRCEYLYMCTQSAQREEGYVCSKRAYASALRVSTPVSVWWMSLCVRVCRTGVAYYAANERSERAARVDSPCVALWACLGPHVS